MAFNEFPENKYLLLEFVGKMKLYFVRLVIKLVMKFQQTR